MYIRRIKFLTLITTYLSKDKRGTGEANFCSTSDFRESESKRYTFYSPNLFSTIPDLVSLPRRRTCGPWVGTYRPLPQDRGPASRPDINREGGSGSESPNPCAAADEGTPAVPRDTGATRRRRAVPGREPQKPWRDRVGGNAHLSVPAASSSRPATRVVPVGGRRGRTIGGPHQGTSALTPLRASAIATSTRTLRPHPRGSDRSVGSSRRGLSTKCSREPVATSAPRKKRRDNGARHSVPQPPS